jgi:hypothetical protein
MGRAAGGHALPLAGWLLQLAPAATDAALQRLMQLELLALPLLHLLLLLQKLLLMTWPQQHLKLVAYW